MKFILSKAQLEQLRKADSILYYGIFPGLWGNADGSITLHLDSPGYSGKSVGEAFRKNFPAYAKAHGLEANAESNVDDPDMMTNPDTSLAVVQPAKPAAPAEPAKPLISWRERLALEQTAHRFLYWRTQGLLPTEGNDAMLGKYMSDVLGGVYTPQNLDRAVEALRPQLVWYQAPVTEYIGKTKEVRLPLGTKPSSRHSAVQLQDLDRRERQALDAARRRVNTELARKVLS